MKWESSEARIEAAVRLARELQRRAAELQTPQERRQQRELDRMLQTPGDKVTLVQLTDEAFRSRAARARCSRMGTIRRHRFAGFKV